MQCTYSSCAGQTKQIEAINILCHMYKMCLIGNVNMANEATIYGIHKYTQFV